MPSMIRDVWIGLLLGEDPTEGELESEPIVLAARRAEMGLDTRTGTSP